MYVNERTKISIKYQNCLFKLLNKFKNFQVPLDSVLKASFGVISINFCFNARFINLKYGAYSGNFN